MAASAVLPHSKNQEEIQRFPVYHTVNERQDQHLLEASVLLWRCYAAAYTYVMDQHLSSVMALLSLYKPSAQERHKERHQPWSPTQDGSGPVHPQGDGSCVRVDFERGRAFPDGHHVSGVMGLFVPTWLL